MKEETKGERRQSGKKERRKGGREGWGREEGQRTGSSLPGLQSFLLASKQVKLNNFTIFKYFTLKFSWIFIPLTL